MRIFLLKKHKNDLTCLYTKIAYIRFFNYIIPENTIYILKTLLKLY